MIEDLALLEIMLYSNPKQWAIDIMDERIRRVTAEIRADKKIINPRKPNEFYPEIIKTHEYRRAGRSI